MRETSENEEGFHLERPPLFDHTLKTTISPAKMVVESFLVFFARIASHMSSFRVGVKITTKRQIPKPLGKFCPR